MVDAYETQTFQAIQYLLCDTQDHMQTIKITVTHDALTPHVTSCHDFMAGVTRAPIQYKDAILPV